MTEAAIKHVALHSLASRECTPAHLAVPLDQPVRRTSLESAFSGSDVSELSFACTTLDDDQQEGLVKTLTNVSSILVSNPPPPPSKWRARIQDFWIENYGAFLVVVSQLFGCMMVTSTRLLETPGLHGTPMHPFQILFVRQSVTSAITCTYALWSKSVPDFPFGPSGKIRVLLVVRGICGSVGVLGLYYSLRYLPVNEATILTFLAPIGASYAFSLLIPGESFSRRQQLAALVSLVGVVFIARPALLFGGGAASSSPVDVEVGLPGNTTQSMPENGDTGSTSAQHLQAVGMALLGVVGGICALTAIRAIGTRAHALLSVNYFSVWCTLVSLTALIVSPDVQFRVPANTQEWSWLAILGISGFVMQLLLTQGMAYGGPSTPVKNHLQELNPDIEMEGSHTVGQNASTASESSNRAIAQAHHLPPHSKQIKGSGAKATSMLYTQMLFALIADKLIFGITPQLLSWIGTGFILTGAIWVAAESGKKKSTRPVVLPVHPAVAAAVKPTAFAQEEQIGLLTDVDGTHEHVSERRLATAARSRDRDVGMGL